MTGGFLQHPWLKAWSFEETASKEDMGVEVSTERKVKKYKKNPVGFPDKGDRKGT